LSQPKVRAAIEAQVTEAAQAAKIYREGLAQNALATTSYVLGQFPEFQGLGLQEASAQLSILEKQSPARAREIRAALEAPRTMMQEAMRLDHQERAHQAQVQQQQWSQYTKTEDAKFAKSVEKYGADTMATVQKEIVEFVKENGLDPQAVRHFYENDPAIRSAPFQQLIFDAMRFRAAQRTATANPASRDRIPQVQKPGVARTSADRAAASIGNLAREFRDAKGSRQLELAVKLQQAKRAARG
jgi:hypothetical protein